MSAHKVPLATIFGCSGPRLTEDERRFFRETDPFGFILFARNCQDPEQVRALVAALRESVGRSDAPVLIDQEGGRVARLKPPHWRAAPPAARIAALPSLDAAREAVWLNARLIAEELGVLGIDVDCAPLLDVPVPGAHDVIGDRAFGRDPDVIADLGRAACDGFLAGGVLPVVKHIPGHGRAMVDSHLALPLVDTDAETLRRIDFAPFRKLADAPWAMTAHVVYTAFDRSAPATMSERVIREVIRGDIGFDGLLLSDDLSMKALGGPFRDRAASALRAGCDVVLHCNGERAEMEAVAAGARALDADALRRVRNGRAMMRAEPFDAAQGLARFNALMATGEGVSA